MFDKMAAEDYLFKNLIDINGGTGKYKRGDSIVLENISMLFFSNSTESELKYGLHTTRHLRVIIIPTIHFSGYFPPIQGDSIVFNERIYKIYCEGNTAIWEYWLGCTSYIKVYCYEI